MKAKGGEIRRSTARKALVVNAVFADAVAHVVLDNYTAKACNRRVEKVLNEIWDNTLNRIFWGASKQLDEGKM